MSQFSDQLIKMTRSFSRQVNRLTFGPPVEYIYNPLDYARQSHEQFIHLYATSKKKILFLGMNPGPFGMAQTGVPFGEVDAVKNWLKISGPVKKPHPEHPKRPVLGFDCHRKEVSGQRLWGFFAEEFGTAKKFFKNHFVINYCPLVFMAESGKNITPPDLKKAEVEELYQICDTFLSKVIDHFEPGCIVGIGKFAASRARAALADPPAIIDILHPSPASPLANRGWAPQAKAQLVEKGAWL